MCVGGGGWGGGAQAVDDSLIICVSDGSKTSIHSYISVAGMESSSQDFGGVLFNRSRTNSWDTGLNSTRGHPLNSPGSADEGDEALKKICVRCLCMNVLFYICVETDSGDLTWERVYMYLCWLSVAKTVNPPHSLYEITQTQILPL